MTLGASNGIDGERVVKELRLVPLAFDVDRKSERSEDDVILCLGEIRWELRLDLDSNTGETLGT